MQAEFLQRLLDLMEKTGDRVIFADRQTGKAVVLMDLEAYERLHGKAQAVAHQDAQPVPVPQPSPVKVARPLIESRSARKRPTEPVSQEPAFSALTQTELLDKINRDISAWKEGQERHRAEELQSVAKKMPSPTAAEDAREEEERFFLEPIQ